jgi:hypothetical protein
MALLEIEAVKVELVEEVAFVMTKRSGVLQLGGRETVGSRRRKPLSG